MEAGSITFSTALDNKQLEKDLSSLTKKIEKSESSILATRKELEKAKESASKLAQKLSDARTARLPIAEQLEDATNKAGEASLKINRLKSELEEAQAALNNPDTNAGFDLPLEKFLKYQEDLKKLPQEIKNAEKEYERLNSESVRFTKQVNEHDSKIEQLNNSLSKQNQIVSDINSRLENETADLSRQKEEAGHIVQQLDEAKKAAGGMGGALERAEEKLSAVLQKLQQQQSVAVEVNKALGDVVDTQTRLTGLAEEFSLGAKIGLVGLAKSAVHVAGLIAQGVPGALKSASSAVSGFSQSVISKIPSLFSKAAKFVGELSKKIVGITKNMNVFSKLSDGLSQKFKRLGSTIKSALVFSVIYKGLATVREQMGAYLAVNTQFSTSLRQLQGVLLTAFQPIYDVVLPALTALANGLAQAIAVVSQFTARLFGTTAKQSQKSAEALYNEANALKATGKAAEEAAGSLAGFDEINTIQTENQGGGGGAADTGPLFDYEYEETPFDSWGEAFSGFLDILLSGIPKLEAKLSDFAKWLNGFTKKLYDMFTFPGVLEKVQQLGADIANALNNLVLQINWYQLGQALGAGMNLALQFLVNLIYGFDWINLGSSLAAMVNGAVSEIDWYAVGQLLWAGFKIAIETLAGFLLGLDMVQLAEAASNIVMGFFTEMKNTIQRIPWYEIGTQISSFLNNIDWYGCIKSAITAIQSALRAMVQAVSGFVNTLHWNEIAEEIYTAINDSLRDTHLFKSMAETLSDLVVRVFDFVTELIAGINWRQIGEDVATFLTGIDWGAVATACFTAIGAAFGAATQFLWGLIKDAWSKVVNWWHDVAYEDGKFTLQGLLDGILDVMKSIGIWIKEHIFDPFVNGFKKVFGIHSPSTVMAELGGYIMQGLLNGLSSKFSDIKNALIGLWDDVKKWWKTNVAKYLTLDYWKGLGKDIIDGFWSGLKNAWDGLSSWFSGVWDNLFSNRKVSVGVTGTSSAGNYNSGSRMAARALPSIAPVSIPALAKGAVIPPNREFMAVLGDQRSGTNIEAPLETIKQALAEVMQSSGSGGDIVVNITTTLDGRVLARNQVRHINDMSRQAGKPVLLI